MPKVRKTCWIHYSARKRVTGFTATNS